MAKKTRSDKDLLLMIAYRFEGIDYEDLATAERQTVDLLVRYGYAHLHDNGYEKEVRGGPAPK